MKKYIKLLRINHYVKNLLIFLPIFFNKSITDINKLIITIVGTIAFSLIASIVYIINDIKDIEKDRIHPVKKNRPIASGEISVHKAYLIILILFTIAIALLYAIFILLNSNLVLGILYLLIYLLLNIAYSFGLKNKPIVDVVILACGFVIRVLYGGAIIDVKISSWLYLTIFAVSFYLGLGKRRNEYKKYLSSETREVLKYYTKDFLDKNMYVCISLAISFYALWAKDSQNNIILWTVPVVMIMAMKYSLNIENESSEGDPVNVILHDKMLIVLGFIYVILITLGMYIN